MEKAILILLSCLLLLSCKKEGNEQSYVLLISIDGFRHDYAERYQATNLLKIAREGTQTTSLIPCYPSKTFPNHYSIVTGLYPENHGIVDNYFYDPELDDSYMANSGEDVREGDWYGGIPIWSLVNQQGLKSATYFWIGSEAEINETRPTYYKKFNPSTKPTEVSNQIVDWLKLPAESRPHFIGAYYSLVDAAGHTYGVDSPELKNAVNEMDNQIGWLRNEIDQLNLPINIVIVSDHGMTNTNYQKPIYLSDFIDLDSMKHVIRDSHTMVYASDTLVRNTLYNTLKINKGKKYKIHHKEEIPKEYNFRNNVRIGDILLVANHPHIFSKRNWVNGKGTHGYDPINKDMHGIFYAIGPDIQENLQIDAFENIHLYPMLAKILQLSYDTTQIDGDPKVLDKVTIE